DKSAVALGVDKRVDRVLRGGACDELAIPAPRSRMVGDPDVRRETPQYAQAALAVGSLFWIPRRCQHSGVTHAHDVQNAVTVADGERPRGAAAGVPGCDVRGERDRPDTNRVAVLESVVNARWRVAEDADPDEGPQWQDDVGLVPPGSEGVGPRDAGP